MDGRKLRIKGDGGESVRVTLDLDWPAEWKLLAAYFNCKNIFGRVDEIRRSSRGHGYHLIIRGLPMTYIQSLKFRAWLGDCETRLKYDSDLSSHKPKQILFCNKDKGHVQPIDERNLLALPFWSKIPRGCYVRKNSGRSIFA